MAYLGTLRDGTGQPIDGPALDTIAALLERAEIEQHGTLGRGDPLHAKGSKRKPGTGADHDAPDHQQTHVRGVANFGRPLVLQKREVPSQQRGHF